MQKHFHWLVFILLLMAQAHATECHVTLDGKVKLDWLLCDVSDSNGVISFEQGNFFTAEIKGGILRSNIRRFSGPKNSQNAMDDFGRAKVDTDGTAQCYRGGGLEICTREDHAAAALTQQAAPKEGPFCKRFAEDQVLHLTGFLAVTDQKGEEEGVERGPYMFMFLDTPLCFEKDPDQPIRTIEISRAPEALLGRHVAATAKMIAGLDWSAEIKKIAYKSER